MVKHLINPAIAAVGLNGMAFEIGDQKAWWINLIGAIIAMIVSALLAKQKKDS